MTAEHALWVGVGALAGAWVALRHVLAKLGRADDEQGPP